MKEHTWYDAFVELLQDKYPKKAPLTYEIMDLLYLEREATYRRLRKDVAFTAHEIATIANALNISLDSIIGVNSGKIPFQMLPINYLNPSPKEFANLQKRVKMLEHLQTAPSSEYMEVCSRFPRPLHIGFSALYRLLIFYWAYQYHTDESQKQFSKVIISDNIKEEFDRYKKLSVHVKDTSFILDEDSDGVAILEIRVTNSCRENVLNLSTINEQGISTKGEGRGSGLPIVEKMMLKYENIYISTKVSDGKFMQLLEIVLEAPELQNEEEW